ncbi:uncharacterized protein LOC132274703 [Cornus florida]|uniref:uncharacterized protein LOC132274703 n=1 Tax=Cornus florida TaxID=4283 RepID=UPI0028A14A66|nr:uncharacterized protein LOC132274703 [Cornus florida]
MNFFEMTKLPFDDPLYQSLANLSHDLHTDIRNPSSQQNELLRLGAGKPVVLRKSRFLFVKRLIERHISFSGKEFDLLSFLKSFAPVANPPYSISQFNQSLSIVIPVELQAHIVCVA